MNFSFNFVSDDIEDEAEGSGRPTVDVKACSSEYSKDGNWMKAKELSLERVLSSLPSSLQYRMHALPASESGQTSKNADSFPRRELQDIRAQIMAESDPSNVDEVLEAGLSGLGDLSSGVYEGGFKTWECSYDLASHIRGRLTHGDFGNSPSFVELGAGTALPSSVAFDHMIRFPAPENPEHERLLILADYNEAVLCLCTVPNLLLTWVEAMKPTQCISTIDETHEDGYLDVTDQLKAQFLECLQANRIRLVLIAGGWGHDFVAMVKEKTQEVGGSSTLLPTQPLVIAASETIYSPATLNTFTDTVLELLDGTQTSENGGMKKADSSVSRPTALIAAKQIYFGVGGGVDEFKQAVAQRMESVEDQWTGGQGVGRWIGQIRRNCDMSRTSMS